VGELTPGCSTVLVSVRRISYVTPPCYAVILRHQSLFRLSGRLSVAFFSRKGRTKVLPG